MRFSLTSVGTNIPGRVRVLLALTVLASLLPGPHTTVKRPQPSGEFLDSAHIAEKSGAGLKIEQVRIVNRTRKDAVYYRGIDNLARGDPAMVLRYISNPPTNTERDCH